MRGLPQKQNARRADKIRLCGHLGRYKKIVKKTYIISYIITGRKLFEKYPALRQKLWKGQLWNHSYYVETIGSVSEENIRRYIEHQSKSY